MKKQESPGFSRGEHVKMDPREAIKLANEHVSIIDACNMVGMELGDFTASSMKVYCPWGHVTHMDGGMSKSMRVYPETNSAFCFASCGYLTPVKMIALDRDVSEEEAAEILLTEINYVPPDYMSKWNALIAEQIPVNTSALAEALKVACARMTEDWDDVQFDDEISTKLVQCLGLLPKVQTNEDADKWLDVSKIVMKTVLQGLKS